MSNVQQNSTFNSPLTLPMLRLLSSKGQRREVFWKPSKPCHVGIHWKAVTEYSQMSTHSPEFQSFFQLALYIEAIVVTCFLQISRMCCAPLLHDLLPVDLPVIVISVNQVLLQKDFSMSSNNITQVP